MLADWLDNLEPGLSAENILISIGYYINCIRHT